MAQEDQYFLGYSPSEQERLRRQAQQLAHEARWLIDRIGLASGGRVRNPDRSLTAKWQPGLLTGSSFRPLL